MEFQFFRKLNLRNENFQEKRQDLGREIGLKISFNNNKFSIIF